MTEICTGCQRKRKIVFRFSGAAEVNGRRTIVQTRLCHACLKQQTKKTPQQ